MRGGPDLALVVGLERVEDLDLVLVLLRLGLSRQVLVLGLELDRVSLGARSEVHFLSAERDVLVSTESLMVVRGNLATTACRAALLTVLVKRSWGQIPATKGWHSLGS